MGPPPEPLVWLTLVVMVMAVSTVLLLAYGLWKLRHWVRRNIDSLRTDRRRRG